MTKAPKKSKASGKQPAKESSPDKKSKSSGKQPVQESSLKKKSKSSGKQPVKESSPSKKIIDYHPYSESIAENAAKWFDQISKPDYTPVSMRLEKEDWAHITTKYPDTWSTAAWCYLHRLVNNICKDYCRVLEQEQETLRRVLGSQYGMAHDIVNIVYDLELFVADMLHCDPFVVNWTQKVYYIWLLYTFCGFLVSLHYAVQTEMHGPKEETTRLPDGTWGPVPASDRYQRIFRNKNNLDWPFFYDAKRQPGLISSFHREQIDNIYEMMDHLLENMEVYRARVALESYKKRVPEQVVEEGRRWWQYKNPPPEVDEIDQFENATGAERDKLLRDRSHGFTVVGRYKDGQVDTLILPSPQYLTQGIIRDLEKLPHIMNQMREAAGSNPQEKGLDLNSLMVWPRGYIVREVPPNVGVIAGIRCVVMEPRKPSNCNHWGQKLEPGKHKFSFLTDEFH